MKLFIEVDGQPLAGITSEGERSGVLRAGSQDLAREYIALAHGYGDWDQLCREIPDAARITITEEADS